MIGSAFVENKIQWASKFRSVLALRGDEEKFVVTSLAYPDPYGFVRRHHRHSERAQFRLGRQVSAQPQSKFDFWTVGQYRVLFAGWIQFSLATTGVAQRR